MVYYVWYVRAFIITIRTETTADNILIHATYGTKITHLQSHVDFLFPDYHPLAFFCYFPPLASSRSVSSVRMCCVVKEHTMSNINIKKTSFIIVLFNFYFQCHQCSCFCSRCARFFRSSSLCRSPCVCVCVIPNHRIDGSLCVKQDFTLLSFVWCPIFIGVAKKSTMKNLCFTRRFVCFEWIMEMSCNQRCFFLLLLLRSLTFRDFLFFSVKHYCRSLLSSARNVLISVNDLITAKTTQKMTVTEPRIPTFKMVRIPFLHSTLFESERISVLLIHFLLHFRNFKLSHYCERLVAGVFVWVCGSHR